MREHDLGPEQLDAVLLDGCERWARSHADESVLLRVLPRDSQFFPRELFPFEDGEPLDQFSIDTQARAALPEGVYDHFLEQSYKHLGDPRVQADTRRALHKDDIILPVPHTRLDDILFAQAAYSSGLNQYDIPHTNAIIVNHMIRFLEVNMGSEDEPLFVPMSEVLKRLEHRIFYTFPMSDSAELHIGVLPNSEDPLSQRAQSLNTQMGRSFVRHMRRGGVVLGYAPSASVVKPITEGALEGDFLIPHVSTASARLLRHGYVQPLTLGFNEQAVLCEYDSAGPQKVSRFTSKQFATAMMEKMAELLTTPDGKTLYDYDGMQAKLIGGVATVDSATLT